MVPKSFGLKVVENVGDAPLEGFYFEVKWMLEVKQVARCLSRAGVARRVDPDVRGVEIGKEVSSLVSVDGGKGMGLCETPGLKPFVGVAPEGG